MSCTNIIAVSRSLTVRAISIFIVVTAIILLIRQQWTIPLLSIQTFNTILANKSAIPNIWTVNNKNRCEPFTAHLDNNSPLFDCNWTKTPMNTCDQILRASLSCKSSIPDIIFQLVSNDTQPTRYEYNDTCLDAVIKNKCQNGTDIPKLVHIVNFGRRELQLYGMFSLISAFRFVQPCLILIHGDYLPYGRYWDFVVTRVPNILFIHREKPTSIFGHEIQVVEHSSDVARLEAVRRFGGIYVDGDYVIVNPLDKLLKYPVVMSVETDGLAIGNSVFLGKSRAKFLDIWYDTYQSFNDKEWGTTSVIMPFKLNQIFPQIGLHLEENLIKPWKTISMDVMYTKHYNWTRLYGVHLYARISKWYLNEKLETFNSSMGEIVRKILYGNPTSCLVKV